METVASRVMITARESRIDPRREGLCRGFLLVFIVLILRAANLLSTGTLLTESALAVSE
jgi:hypothetical protein